MSEWKPGDVRVATVNGQRMLVLRGRGIFEGNWYTQGPVAGSRLSVSDSWLLDDRPLVVIDPEDREQVERLNDLIWATNDEETASNDLQAALREFANPTPSEPTDPTAHVTDHRENIWRQLADGDWVCTSGPDIGEYLAWGQLASDRGPLTIEVRP